MKIPSGVSNPVGNVVNKGREVLPSATPAVGKAVDSDTFAAPADRAQRLLGGLPHLPRLDELRQTAKGASEKLNGLLGDVKERAGDFYGTAKEVVIREGLEVAFAAIEALPGEIDQKALNRVMELGGVKAPERPLSEDELAILKPIFGDGLDYESIRVRVGDIGLFNQDDRPLVIGNSILIPEGRLKNGEIRKDDLVHEALHNWQFQQGGLDYIKESFQDQLLGGAHAYDISEALKNRTPWNEVRTENQAVIIETAYEKGFFNDPPKRVVIDGVDHTDYFRDCVKQMQAGQGAPGGAGDA